MSNLRYEPFFIDFKEQIEKTPSDIRYITEKGVSCNFKNSLTPAPQGSGFADVEAGFILDFTADNSFYLNLSDVKKHSIPNQMMVEQKILELYKNKRWDRNYSIITGLFSAKSGTIILSKNKGAKAEIKLKAGISLNEFEIGKAESIDGFNTKNLAGLDIIGRKGLTPLFEAVKIDDPWIFSPEIKDVSFARYKSKTYVDKNLKPERIEGASKKIISIKPVMFDELDEESI